MEKIKIGDKFFKPFISAQQIESAVKNVADKMNDDLKDKNPVFICILNGAFMFAADLYRFINIDSQITFMRMKSYEGMSTTGNVKMISGLLEDIKDRTVVVVEDIIDTGYTMQGVIEQLKERGAKDVYVSTLLYKPEALKVKDLQIDYV